MKVVFVATGGTIDKVYFDAMSTFQVGDSMLIQMLKEANVRLDYEVIQLMRKDSLELSEEDRESIRDTIANHSDSLFIVTHGTDTMVETAKAVATIAGKTIVITGALSPARFKGSDALFNLGSAVAAVQTLKNGTYICMNGQLFDPTNVKKNRRDNCFEALVE
jgi:L-asparaginase